MRTTRWTSARGPSWAVAAMAVVLIVAIGAGRASRASAVDAGSPAPTVPAAEVQQADPCKGPGDLGFGPADARARWDLDPLWAQGYDGSGVTVAQIQFGASVDQAALTTFTDCLGLSPVTVHQWPADVPYPPSGESMSDAEIAVGLADGLEDLYVFIGDDDVSIEAITLDPLLKAALDPANTGGSPVDIISLSYNSCEQEYGPQESTEAILAEAVARGVWVFKGAGDSGSSDCATHGTCAIPPDAPPYYLDPAVDYPASSPSVVSLGGVQLSGAAPTSSASVWSWPDVCAASGGGVSMVNPAPSWQSTVPGGLTDPMRMVPDVAGLAGYPGWLTYKPDSTGAMTWQTNDGDSLTGPMFAGAMAIVRQAMVDNQIPVDRPLGPALYAIAADPVGYETVFMDVVQGTNDLFGVGCCTAGPGYDLVTGLGEVRFAALYQALALAALIPAPAPPTPSPAVTPAFTG